MKAVIAYIDDKEANLECVETILNNEFHVETFQNGQDFFSKFSNSSYVTILLDIHMPEVDGFGIYEKIVEHPNYNGCPILFISSDDSNTSRIKSFELGAVDFLSREIYPDELIARIKSKIKFFEQHRNIVEFSSLRVNLTLLKTFVNGNEVPITFIELKLLCLLLRNYPDYVPKSSVVEEIWKKSQVMDATLYTHIFNLNLKLKDWDHEILTIKGKGIQIVSKNGDLSS